MQENKVTLATTVRTVVDSKPGPIHRFPSRKHIKLLLEYDYKRYIYILVKYIGKNNNVDGKKWLERTIFWNEGNIRFRPNIRSLVNL